jgi:AraC-like DNA-binding protein
MYYLDLIMSAIHATVRSARLSALLAELEGDLREGSVPSLRVGDLARAAGVSVRTVYRAASRRLHAPPMTRLRLSRLQGVRGQILAASPGETVTNAALDWGFTHLGRFAALYRREFGESPSETLRRARSSQGRRQGNARGLGDGFEAGAALS